MKNLDRYKVLEWLGMAIVVAGGVGLLTIWTLEAVVAMFFIVLIALVLIGVWLLVWKLIPWVYYFGGWSK